MADAALYNSQGEKVDDIALPDAVFDAPLNNALVHQALVRLGRVRRVPSARVKTRSEISRTTAKWYRQKGTGHARHGSRSAAGFVGGYKAHGPHGCKTEDALPRRMRRQAIFVAVSDKRRHGRLTVLDRFEIDAFSTKRFVEILEKLEAFGKQPREAVAKDASDSDEEDLQGDEEPTSPTEPPPGEPDLPGDLPAPVARRWQIADSR